MEGTSEQIESDINFTLFSLGHKTLTRLSFSRISRTYGKWEVLVFQLKT